VKPADFDLHQPRTVEEALDLLAEHAAVGKVLAGGQSLVPLLNFRLARPEHLIDLSKIAALRSLSRTAGVLSVGAMVTYAQAQRSPAVTEGAPLLSAAIPHIGHDAIRARGTIGGSVAHGDPAAEVPAVAVALDAEVIARSVRGTRTIAAAEFFTGNLMTRLADDELLVEVRFAHATPGTGAAFEEVGRRSGDFALAGAGAQVRVESGVIAEARLCLTGVASRPVRISEAEQLLVGAELSASTTERVVDIVRSRIDPSGDLHAPAEYRRAVAGTLAARALAKASQRATENSSHIYQEASR